MQNNDCVHNFSDWKKIKKIVVDCESMDENARAFAGTGYTRKCKFCGLVDTKFEKEDKKGKVKKLSLNKNK